jgi:non-heme chloroperoxidase
MTSRRVFLGAFAAASVAVVLPRLAYGQGHATKIKTRDGTELFVKDTGGNGRAVVMTHAWPLNADVWDYQALLLSKAGFRVVTYDRRGFGRSGQPAGGYDFDTFADDLAEVIEQTGVRDVTLVGYSMGGGEVVRYFSRHKGRHVVKAGLVAAAGYYLLKAENNPIGIDGAAFDGIKQGVQGDRRTYLAHEMIDQALAMAMQASAVATAACVDAVAKTDFRTELTAIGVPTLVLHGTADIPVPFAIGKAMAAGIAQAKLIAYADASHGIVLTERDRVARDLQAFIAS